MSNVESASALAFSTSLLHWLGPGQAKRNRLTVSDCAGSPWRGELTAAVKGRYSVADAQATQEIDGSWSDLGRSLVGLR